MRGSTHSDAAFRPLIRHGGLGVEELDMPAPSGPSAARRQ